MEQENIERFALMSKALGHPIRLQILSFLASMDTCMVGNIVNVLPVTQSTTSGHLKILKEAGWIHGTIEGSATCYCLNQKNIEWYKNKTQELI